MKCYRIRVEGRVQGVFFRASTKGEADKLGVSGWVRNESDGTVLIEVEGDEIQLKSLVEWCRVGPPMATVDQINVEEITMQGSQGFRITY